MTWHYNVYDIIATVRLRPSMYLGEWSLIRMGAFIGGCAFVAHEVGAESRGVPDFGGFHDWVARRFGWRESTAGWCSIILQESGGDDRKALESFFELVDEYRQAAGSKVREPS